MATEADIAEAVPISKNVGESAYLERLVGETIPGEVKIFQGMLNLPPETAQHSAETENKQAAIEPETMITIIEGNVETAKGEKFFESPYAVEVAGEETCRVSKHCQDEEVPIQGDREITEDEKQVRIKKIEVGDGTGSGGIKIMPEPEEIPEKNDMSSDIVNLSGNGFQIEKIEESNLRIGEEISKEESVVDQHAEVIIDQDVSVEDKSSKKETIDMHKMEKDGILEATGETSSEKADKFNNLVCQEKNPGPIEACEAVEDEKDEREMSVCDNAREMFTPSIAAHPDIKSDKEATLNIKDGVEETVYKPSITTATDVSSTHEAGPEAGEELKEASGVACEEKSQDVTEPSEEIKYITQLEDEMSQKDSIDTFATQTEETCSEKVDNPRSFKVPSEIQSDDIKEIPEEVEQIAVIERTTKDDSISRDENPEQKGDASFLNPEGTLSVNEQVAAADASSGENRYEEGSTVLETKENSDDTEIIDAVEHSQEEEKLERSMSVVNEDFIVSACAEHTEKIACVIGEESIKVQEERFDDKIDDALEDSRYQISDIEERPENLQQNKPEKEKIEESWSVVAADFGMVAPTESAETTTGDKGETPIESQEESCEEILKEDSSIHTDTVTKKEIAEEKNISSIELNEKIECAQVEVKNPDAIDLHVTDPLIEAAVENEGKTSDSVPNLEAEGQVREANEAAMEEEKHTEDAPEAHQSGNCILEHPSTEGGVTTELVPKTSKAEVEKLQEVYSLESEEKSVIKDSGEKTDSEMQNNEEACDSVKPELVAESDDAVKSTTDAETPIEINSAIFTRDEKIEQEFQAERPLKAESALKAEDESYLEDNNERSNATSEEVHDGKNITGSGVPVNEKVMEGFAPHISEGTIRQEINQVTPENKNKAEKSQGENIIEQTSEESNPASVEQVPEDLQTAEIFEISKTQAVAKSIEIETGKNIESSEEITATETSVEEKPQKNEPGEKLEQPFSSNENETFSSDADKIPCLTDDGAPQNLEETPQKKENEKLEENNNAKENKLTADEEDLEAVAEASDATRSTESIALELKSDIDNMVIEDELKKEESKEINEDGKEAGKQTLKEENLVDQFSELEVEKIEQSVNEDHAVACISPESAEQETVEISGENSVKEILEETNITGQIPESESVEQVPLKNTEDNEKKAEDSTAEIFETSKTGEGAEIIENKTSNNIECTKEILDTTQGKQESVQSEEKYITATESSPEEKPQENVPEEKLERTLSLVSGQNETLRSDVHEIQCLVQEGASRDLEEAPQNEEKETEETEDYNDTKENKIAMEEDVQVLDEPTEASQSTENIALEQRSEIDNITIENETKKETKESEDLKDTEKDEEIEKQDPIGGGGPTTILLEPIGEKVLQSCEGDEKEEETHKIEGCAQLETTSIHEDAEKETPEEENKLDKSSELEGEKIEQGFNGDHAVAACISSESFERETVEISGENNVNQTLEETNIAGHVPESVEQIPLTSTEDGEKKAEDSTREIIEKPKMEEEAESIENETSITIDCPEENVQSEGKNISATESSPEKKSEENESGEEIERTLPSVSDKSETCSSDADKIQCLVGEGASQSLEETPQIEEKETEEDIDTKKNKIATEVLDERTEASKGIESIAPELQSETDNKAVEDEIKEECKQSEELKDTEKGEETVQHDSAEDCGTATISPEPIREKVLQSPEGDEKEEQTPEIEASAQLETISVHEDAEKQTPEEENIVKQSSELEGEKIEQSLGEDQVAARISSESVEQEVVEIPEENSVKQIQEETTITGHVSESVEQVPFKNIEDNEKKAEDSTGEIIANAKTEEKSESIENETSRTIVCPKEILDTTQGYQGENVQSEGKSITATESSPDEKSRENESEEKIERTLPLVYDEIESFSSDANEIQCPAEEGASQNLEEVPQNKEKETEACKSSESKALSGIDNIAGEDEIKKEECEESEDLKDTEEDEETEKHDSVEDSGVTTILPEAVGEKVVQSSEEDKKEEETPKFEACAQLETASLDEDAEKETLKEESIVDQSRELEVEKIEQSYREEDTPRVEACSLLGTTSGDEDAGKEDPEKENIVEQSRELEIEKIEESSKEDNVVAYISSGPIEQETVKVSQGNENKAEESEGENNIEHIVEESSIRSLIPESVQQVPIVNLINEEKKAEETTGENFEDSKTVEAAECIENETSKTIESAKEHGEDVQSEGKNITATESSPEGKPQENKPGEKLEQTLSLVSGQNETSSSDVNKIQCLVEDGASQNLEEAKGNEEKEKGENNDTKENKITSAEELQVLDETTKASKSNENLALEARPEIDDIAVEDEIKKEEPKESEELKDTEKDEETEKHDSAEECGPATILPEPIGEKVLQSSAEVKKEEQTPKIEACEQLETTSVDEEDKKEEETPKFEACAQLEITGLEEDEEKETLKEERIVDQSRELEVEKTEQSSKEEETPRIEACSQLETMSGDEDAGKEDPEKENIVEQSRELEIEKIDESSKEDNAIAYIQSGSIEQETVKVSQGNENKAEESGENNIEQNVEESSIRGLIAESVQQVPIVNLINEEKKDEETAGENFGDSKTVEAAECIENETCKTIESPKEMLDTMQRKSGEDVQSEGKNITATESSPEEKPQENEPGEKLEQTLSLLSGQNEISSSDVNKIQCLVEDGASQNLEEAKGNEEKETEENNDTKENKITLAEDLQVLDETTEASKSNESMALEAWPEIDDLAVEDEIKKEEPKESEELKDTGKDEETEKDDSAKECGTAVILPEPIGEKVLQSSAEDKKEEQTHKIEVCEQIETINVDEEAEKQTPKEETTVDQSRELEVEKVKQSSREEETPRFEACSQHETTSIDQSAGKEDLKKENIVEQSRELEIEKIAESSKEDNTVAYISSGERETAEISQGIEIRAEESEGENNLEQIVEESSIRGLIPESVEQVPIDNLTNEEKKAEETTGENFEDSKTVEAAECIENETSKTIESPKEILDTTQGKQGEDVQSEGKNIKATESSPEGKPQENESGEKLEQASSFVSGQNETYSSDANKIQCLMEDGSSQNLEKAKGNEEKETEENSDTQENKITSEEDLQVLDETTEASKSNEKMVLEARPEIDDIAVEDEKKKEEPKESEELKDTGMDEETEKHDSAEECCTATILPEPIGEKLLQSSAEDKKEEQTHKTELETTSVDEEAENQTPKVETTVDQSREIEVEKIEQSSREEETPGFEACSQLETTSVDENAGKEDLEKENIVEQSRELEIEKIEESSKEDNTVACISSGERETVEICQGNEIKAEESEGENIIQQIVEESSIRGLIPESVQQVPIDNLITEEKKAKETTGENFEDSKAVEASECIENETSKTIESPKEILDTTHGKQGEDVQSEGKNLIATKSSPEEKPLDNEPGEKLEQTLSLVSGQNETSSSDANKIQCLVEDGASQNLEEAKGNEEKQTEENYDTKENKITSEEDLQALDETTEASKSNENIALEARPEIDHIAVEDEIKKEEPKESEELKDTEKDEETEKRDSAEECGTATILPEPIGEKLLQSSAEYEKEEQTPKIEACEQLETTSVDEEDKKEEETPKFEACAQRVTTSLEEDEEKETLKEERIVDQTRELEVEKIEQSSKEEETTGIEACSQLETTSGDEVAGKEDLEKENIGEQSRELEIEKIEESSKEDNAVAYISSALIAQETVKVSQGNENKAEESEGENNIEQIVEESSIKGLIPESVQQVPIVNLINEEKKAEETTGENFEDSKTVEAAECIENETSKTIESPKEMLDTTQGIQGEDVQSEGKNITATESSPEEKPHENEPGEKLEQTLSLVSSQNEAASSDANKMQCLVEDGASLNLEEAKGIDEKETEENNGTNENKITSEEDLQVIDETTEASKSNENIALEVPPEIDDIAVEDEIKKEEIKESKELKDTENNEETEKHDSAEERGTATILPEPIGEKVLQSSAEDKKEEETPKIELETASVDEEAEKQTLKEETIVDQSRELEAEKIEQSSREEETPRIEACSKLETTSVDENAGKKDLEKENIVEHSRELEIEKKIEERSKEDNTVAYISSGEQETVEISQGNEIKAEESEGENKLEQIVEDSSISGLIPESVQQVPIDKANEEKKEEEITGENFENAKTLEAAESIENETSKMIENPKEILDNTQDKQGASMQSEIKNPAVTESTLEDKLQKNESGEKLEHEILSSDGDKIPLLIEEEAPRNLEEVPKKEDNQKEATDFNETKDSKKATNKDLEVVAQTSDEGDNAETIVLKLKSGVDNIVVEDELKKEESKPLYEDCKDGVNEKHDITEECSTANILPEPLGEKILRSSEDTKEEETPKFEACAQLETTNTDEDAEKQTLEGEIIIDQSRELEAEKIEKSSGEEETPRIEACSQLETTSVDKDPAKEDLEKVDIVDQSRELEIEKIKESSKEENTVAHISSESTEQETVEISQGNENMVENSEGKNKIEHIIEESSTRGLIPEPVQQVPLNNLVDEEKKTEKTSAETYENSKREEAAESIAHEKSETIESHKEILDTFQVTQVESLHSEGKNQTATESSVDEKINEDKSPVIVAEENNNDSELVDDKDNSEMKVSKDEDDIEQCSQKNEAGEEIEQPLSLTSDENQAFSSDIDKIPDLMEEGTSQNPKEAQKKEINEKETEESNDTEDRKVPKEEDLQVADEQSDAREITGSTTWEQKLEMEHMEVEEKKEASKELYEDCNDAGKEKETEKHDIEEECSSTNVLQEPIEEKVLHSSEQDKKEEETNKIEACVPLETTIGDEDAEKQTLKEIIVKDSRELGVEIEQISKEDDSAENVSKQEGHEAAQTVDGDEDAGKQNIGGDAENKSEALETADSIPSREKQDIEEDDKQGFLCSSVKEETVKESSQEDESKDVKLKEEVDESDSSSIEKTEVTSSKEETFSETLNDSAESNADSYPLNVSKAPEEELPPKEIHGGPVEKSPMVLDVSDKYKEITAKEEINIDDIESATVKVVTEEICLKEAEPEEKKQVESFAPFEEKGIVETEAKEIMLENIDKNVKPEDISNLGEKRQKEIPPNADQAREEIDHKTENEVPHAGSEDQTTNELSLKEISREVDYSTITEENELVTSKATEAIDETTAESHAPYEDTEIASVARAIDTVVMEKRDRTTCLSNVSELEPVNTGKGTADKEVQQERVEDLYVHHELDHEKSLYASEDVQTSEKEETRELADHSDGCTSKTLEDVESSNVAPNIDEGLKSIETSVVCSESEKSILEQDILKGISEERIEVEKAAIELKEEAHSQRQDDIDSNDTGTQTEEIFKSADPEERVQHDSEVVAGDQSSEILPQSVKSQIDENCNDNQIEEDEKEIKEKEEQKLEVEDQKEQTANETAKAVLITEKTHEGVEECDDSEDIKKLVVEEDRGFNEIHALSIAGETTDKVGITEVQDSSLVYAKVEDSKEKTGTENSEVEEVSTMEREAFFSEQPEKRNVEDSSTGIEPPGKESKKKIEEEVLEESQYGYHKINNKTPTTMTEKSPEEAEPGDKLVEAFHTDLDEPCLETTEIVHNQQCKQVDSMKLETSCDLASELQTEGHGHAESESITTENTGMSEPEEIKTAFEAVYESKGQGPEETVFGKSLTVEKPDQVSTDDHDADRKNVIMENSDTDEVDATKLALDAVDKARDQGDSAGKSLGVEEADQIPATNSQDTEKENVAEEKDPVADVVSSDVVFQSKDQGIGETGKSPNEEKLDADRSEEGCTETTNNRAQGVETVTEDDIIAEQTPSAEKLEQQLQTPASELPLKHGTTTTVVKIEEEKMEKVEILEDAGSEDYSTAKPAEESSLQNDGPEELEVPTLESTNLKDIEDSPTEVLVREEGRQTSDDAIQLKPPENEKIKCLETEKSLSAETPDESEEACKETSVHKAQGVATEGGITAEQTPLTEKLEEQPLTPTSALLFTHGTTAAVEKMEEEKTEKMEVLEEEDLEDSSAAKQPEEVSLLKDSPTELEIPALGSTSNKDESLTEVLVHEEGGQTPVGGIQVEPSGNEATVKCVDASSESKEIIDLSTPAETAYNLKSETNEKDLEPELVIHRHEELHESRDTEVHEKHLGVITGERDEENLSKQTSQVNQIIQNEVSKEEITEEKDVREKYQPSSLYEEKLNESLQEVELKPEECKGETTDRTTETIVTRIQDEELSGEAEKAIASEKIGKQVLAEDRSVEDSDQVSVENSTIKDSFPHEFERKDVENSAIELDSRNQGEESIKGFEEESKLFQESQKSEETFPATTEKQISTEADIIQCPETIVSTGREYVPPVLHEGVTETLQKVEAEDFKPGNSEGFHSEVKEVEHGGEKRTDFTEEETTGKSTLADSDKPSLSYSLQRSTEETIQLAKDVIKEKEPTASAEGMHPEEAETIKVEEKSHEKKEEAEGDEHQKTDSGSDAPVMVEASGEMDVKVTHKKSHGILSGVSSKVKHSISKVRKAITGKSSHHSKPVSPK